MDLTGVMAGLPDILAQMRAAGYSESMVTSTERTAVRLEAVADELDGWDDAFAWAASGKDGGRKYMRAHVRILMRYDAGLGAPRSEGYPGRASTSTRTRLGDGMQAVLDAFEASEYASTRSESTIYTMSSAAACFLSRLEEAGVMTPADATEDDVLGVLTGVDGGPLFSRGSVRQARAVLAACGVDGAARVASWMPVPKEWSKIGDALDDGERDAVLGALSDPDGPLTLRDRAIGRLLYHTGMRRGDVSCLRLDAVDLVRDTITVTQRKTGGCLRLPLLPQVGNAIVDYVREERGPSAEPWVFLATSWPYGRLSPQGVYGVACRVLDAAGVRLGEGDRRGCHLFRRTVATTMTASGIDRAVIASTLGHESKRTTELYIAADVEGLRARALDVSAFPLGEGALGDD